MNGALKPSDVPIVFKFPERHRLFACGYCSYRAKAYDDWAAPYRHIRAHHPAVWKAQPQLRAAGIALGVK